MKGNDPRVESDLYQMVVDIDKARKGRVPTAKQWKEILAIVVSDHKKRPVPIEVSTGVAKTLAEYQHSKKSAIKVDATGLGGAKVAVTPLKIAEVKTFKKVFGDNY